MEFNIKKIQDGLLAFRGLSREQLLKDGKKLKENYKNEALWFKMEDLEFVLYSPDLEEETKKEDFMSNFEEEHDNEYVLSVDKFRPFVNEKYQYRLLREEDTELVAEFKKQFNEIELEYGAVSIEDPVVMGAFDGEKLIAVASMWEWDNDLDDIGLIVDTTYRKQGLGKSVVTKIIQEVMDHKICIYRADYDNPGSVKIAEALGFEHLSKIHRYKRG